MWSWFLGLFSPIVALFRNPKLGLPKFNRTTFAAVVIDESPLFILFFLIFLVIFWKPVPLLIIAFTIEFGFVYSFFYIIIVVFSIIVSVFQLFTEEKKTRPAITLGLSLFTLFGLKKTYAVFSAQVNTLADIVKKRK